jgi:hypothetical protein
MKHLKYFKIFESLDYNDFTGDIEDLTKEEIEAIEDLLLQTGSEFTLDSFIQALNDIKKNDKIKLYRLVWIKDKKDIDVKRLGNHYVSSLDSFDDSWIKNLYPFHHKDGEPDIKDDLWLVSILAPTKDIDYKATLVKNIKFPYEEEIQLKTDLNIEVFEISKYY